MEKTKQNTNKTNKKKNSLRVENFIMFYYDHYLCLLLNPNWVFSSTQTWRT